MRLRGNVNWSNCGGRAVFLDLEADRYFCLSKSANDAFLRLASGRMKIGDTDCLDGMIGRGYLVDDCASSMIEPPPSVERPTCDHPAASIRDLGSLDLLEALVTEIRTVRLLRRGPLRHVIALTASGNTQAGNAPVDRSRIVASIIGSFNATALVTRTHNRCLARALAVYAMCKKRGIGTKLVFGVIGHPFAAHSWVQLESAVLVGGFEHARLYTPILVIE